MYLLSPQHPVMNWAIRALTDTKSTSFTSWEVSFSRQSAGEFLYGQHGEIFKTISPNLIGVLWDADPTHTQRIERQSGVA